MPRSLIPVLVAAALLAPAAPASAASFVAHLKAPGHHPRAHHAWRISVTAHTRSGRALRATAYYKFVLHGQVVGKAYPSPHGGTRHRPWHFKGRYRDTIRWPARAAIGQRLTFRVVVHVKNRGSRRLDYWVRVRR
jgi:hypothetical protein